MLTLIERWVTKALAFIISHLQQQEIWAWNHLANKINEQSRTSPIGVLVEDDFEMVMKWKLTIVEALLNIPVHTSSQWLREMVDQRLTLDEARRLRSRMVFLNPNPNPNPDWRRVNSALMFPIISAISSLPLPPTVVFFPLQ